ncbi:Por secretion system C-terminal sorting domain-containing protein [Dyadobacter soli]|uniref:Por secretion system C-terminal sorting domain-containing protein n=1 Tax=Dyadobacter soli TaxID=659014 RepID=A0A1G7K704_9BACT|nr:M64 family metallopeptidase [Dyadobacter soli]SDF32995.1 Por secretion system C-terminal sorting domain-containing protein [Dyadobacter soli]
MKIIFTTLIAICIANAAFSQHYQVDTLYKNGPLDNRINVVILGDGFTQEQMPTFAAEAKKFADFFLAYNPYQAYRSYFNFFAIRTPSKESGVTNPGNAPDAYKDQPVGNKDTFFGVSFGSQIHRLVEVRKWDVLYSVMASNFPEYDLIVVLANTDYYGGSGGQIAVHTLHKDANTIGVHEIGHTFGRVSDEYWAGSIYGTEAANMTANNDPATIRWKNWLSNPPIGIYKHGPDGDAAKWHKPANGTCLMEYLNQEFCAVCSEATVERLLEIVNPIEKFEPGTAGRVDIDQHNTFNLKLLKPDPSTLQVAWRLNGKLLPFSGEELTLKSSEVPDSAALTASVFDNTMLSRRNDARVNRTREITWSLKSSVPAEFRIVTSADSVCAGEEVVLTALGCPVAPSWSTGEKGKSITVKPEQTTTFSATCNAQGAPIRTAQALVKAMPLPNATATNGGPYTVGQAIELTATGGVTYLWRGPMFFASTFAHVFLNGAKLEQGGLYEVVVTDVNGCSKTAQTEVTVDPILSAPNDPAVMVTVSPNPARDYISVETSLAGRSNITLYDQAGREMRSKSFVKKTDMKLDVAAGMYLYRFTNGSREISGEVAVQ